MITLTKRLRQESDGKPTKTKKEDSRVSVRDKLLVKEVFRISNELQVHRLNFRFKSWRITSRQA